MVSAEDTYATWFGEETLRVDLYHTGNKESAGYSMDEVIIEGPWPGSRTKLIDTLNLGSSMFAIFDAGTGTKIYSRGFSTMFGEWQTTAEAKIRDRTMSEAVRFPKPHKPFILVVYERDDANDFQEVYRVEIDPNFRNVRKEIRFRNYPTYDIHVPAEPAYTLDIVILPEGYTRDEHDKFMMDAQRVATYYLNMPPWQCLKDRIAIRAVEVESRDSGIDEPRKGVWKDTPFHCSFNAFDSARYVLTTANKDIRDVAANVPYDFIIIMLNTDRYGGGGIYNLYTTFAVDDVFAEYLVLHESGHSITGLGDEYYTSQVSYEEFIKPGVEPWEPNVTALLDPENIKWKEFIKEGTPIPTPATEEYADVIGAFEGASYVAKGFYRPTLDSMMKSKILGYGPVNSAHISKVIKFYSDEKQAQ
jgi:hypothetical protein